jgi:hypothetical protein
VSELKFEVFSRGTVTFDLARCLECDTKVCVQVCQTPGNGLILELDEHGLPRLKVPVDQVAKGACVEDMGCMLACLLRGKDAIVFDLPMPEFEKALKSLQEDQSTRNKDGEDGDTD